MALVALGVTGGISAYKAVEVARGLQKSGHDVVAVMTKAAQRFVGPMTFEAITGRPVVIDQFAHGLNSNIKHIAIASDIELLLVAPATANMIGKFANGIADDFLSSLYLATSAPVMIAPAMNAKMLKHPAVCQNLKALTDRGVLCIEPGEGFLACGWIGEGRLAEPAVIVEAAESVLSPVTSLRGLTVMVTAGPTFEDLDPVRYIGNRSSGRMGFALASAAERRGARTILVAGPTHVEPPIVNEFVRVRSAREMSAAVFERVESVDVVVMAAAVADYTPVDSSKKQKLSKSSETLNLVLTRTPDILEELGRWRGHSTRPLLVGFAAETEKLLERALKKLERKQLDLIVANDVTTPGSGFDVETNVATLVTLEGVESAPLQSKTALAELIFERVEQMLALEEDRVTVGE
jgi:phosphopantothenoylcysteine decarboxylase/phosphopantothenate--cysteine ligase